MAEASLVQLVLSGALGALIAATANHVVRRYEARKDKAAQESRTAYVYMTKVGKIVAAGDVIKNLGLALKPMFDAAIKERAAAFPALTENDVPYVISGVIYHALKTRSVLSDSQFKQVDHMMEFLATAAGESLDFSLSPDLQSRLPKSAIRHYALFVENAGNLKRGISTLSELLKGKTDLGPEFIHAQGMAARELYVSALSLFAALKVHGDISDDDAGKILSQYRESMARNHAASQDMQAKMKTVMPIVAEIEKEWREKR